MTIQECIEHIYTSYEKRDFESVMNSLPENFSFHWPIDEKVARYAGLYSGKTDLLGQLEDLAESFEFNKYKAISILVDGDKAAAQIELNLTSKKTGEKFDAALAHFWVFENGSPVHLTEYNDSALLTHYSA